SRGWGYGKRGWGAAKRGWGWAKPRLSSAWSNRWKYIDYGRAYASRGGFIGFGAGLGYCAYKRRWGKCFYYAGYGAGVGATVGSSWGYSRLGWRGVKRAYRWWKNRR
ncbi:hypothetical protein ACFYZI_42425, partial [Streptomyces griseorubiginosus]|uniref:hypothetical protein n=1 Tax=Streptomyces griseorubiginosus TaxID=67304 RepID=UPI0036A79F96